ncbi:30S ribosomal protein S16 [Candidatus Giovannonibacteria bacterium RIFCSPLOWO2_02_FULL_43_11b]|uniref:Small ribosomal subunit protein bS16 n=1 Tax=Candidatus Giovannonibacteria bacterium RIFCSPHIGHO2_12_FULL_43_15 TaxID=1798341 RepID=A0A1F5WPY7_9BACT|nr:MAG: 30S ribosomal protein S16 [Candidatus Giovannonibacteria bacterium RIFCSPHIGHO2_01_FULL_43_100]OGF66356.1 MAG: 30S ribosomal protein S16 [Candidatus Giovannonibacteria bacterium RIFCSPHIGHO2_02_FULL_43_32]OGF77715.1 MAG: 30S ribosomal protein S16 [Candidatus Giovannonibacteria bacterium RIFCSPHIGHO2_12_FULL_43_15]OGF78056.1 MAG: 30S ribosomal protein S16 [Candidatus Giovannonibacteria bacterium RIFCSPLOWO2_01_FULL_43_60]OGF89322.1 MAG: 30S ribosomal protein S16 [Candidatus Giovannonibac
MLMIRLQRVGRRNDPSFRVVITDSHNSTKSGKFIEIVGSYDARHKDKIQLNKERILYRISKGAKATDTMHNLLIKHGIIVGKKIDVSKKLKGAPTQNVGVAAPA